MHTYGVLQKDGTVKNMSKAEFDKYINEHTMHREDIKKLENASGRFIDLADVVEVAIDDMYEDELKKFFGLTTLHKDGNGNIVFDVTVDDMYQLASKIFEFAPKADEWVKNWHEKNEGKAMAYMLADALGDNIFEGMGSLEFLILFLTIFVYNGEVEPENRIQIADWY